MAVLERQDHVGQAPRGTESPGEELVFWEEPGTEMSAEADLSAPEPAGAGAAEPKEVAGKAYAQADRLAGEAVSWATVRAMKKARDDGALHRQED